MKNALLIVFLFQSTLAISSPCFVLKAKGKVVLKETHFILILHEKTAGEKLIKLPKEAFLRMTSYKNKYAEVELLSHEKNLVTGNEIEKVTYVRPTAADPLNHLQHSFVKLIRETSCLK